MSGKEVEDGLVARVEQLPKDYFNAESCRFFLNDSDFLEALRAIKKFQNYEKQRKVDIVVAELHPRLVERIKSNILHRESSFNMVDINNLQLLFEHMYKRVKKIHYATINELSSLIGNVKNEMDNSEQQSLYQICREENTEYVKRLLLEKGFKLI